MLVLLIASSTSATGNVEFSSRNRLLVQFTAYSLQLTVYSDMSPVIDLYPHLPAFGFKLQTLKLGNSKILPFDHIIPLVTL